MAFSEDLEFKAENIFINKNCKKKPLLLLATDRSKFILYSGRLELQYYRSLENEDEWITAGAFNKDSTVIVIGTNMGRIYSYRVSDGEFYKNPYQAVGAETAVT